MAPHCKSRWPLWRLLWSIASEPVLLCSSVRVRPGGSIPEAVQQAAKLGERVVLVEAGVYPTDGAPVFLNISESVHLRAVGGAVLIDCGGKGSALDLLVNSNIDVQVSGIEFRSCSASRLWGVGPRPNWCSDCSCSYQFCSKGGAVTITNLNEDEDVRNASVIFTQCNFTSNQADKGGGVALSLFTNFTDSTFRFDDCSFVNNSATKGAAIDIMVDYAYITPYYNSIPHNVALLQSHFFVSRCHFEGNIGQYEGSIAFWSKAALIEGININISDSAFIRNIGGNGPAMSIHVGVVGSEWMNTFSFEGSQFEENRAQKGFVGGAILSSLPTARTTPDPPRAMFFREYAHKVQMVLRNCVFHRNSGHNGGAYATGNGLHSFDNVSFRENTAVATGGAICLGCVGGGDAAFRCKDSRFSGNLAKASGSTFSSESYGEIVISNCTFDMTGSSQGITDFDFSNAGPVRALEDTVWRCPDQQRLMKAKDTVSSGTGGTNNPDWNHMSLDVRINSMSLACLKCPPNRYTETRAQLHGPVLLFINSTTDPNVVARAVGTTMGAMDGCLACGANQFVEDGTCQSCPTGEVLESPDSMVCKQDDIYLLVEVTFFLVVVAVVKLAPLLLGCPILIDDISLEDSHVVVSTSGNHSLFKHPWRDHRVWLRDTGHPLPDKRTAPWHAQVIDSQRLCLLDEDGKPLTERIDSSMGSVHISHWRAPFSTAYRGVPALALLALGIAFAFALLFFGKIWDRVHWLAVAGAIVGLALNATNRFLARTPLLDRRKKMHRSILCSNPQPTACKRGAERAIPVSKLLDLYSFFQAFIRDRNMHYVCTNIIKPLTEPYCLSYAELIGPSHVCFFVSHYWGSPVSDFCESIEKHARQVAAHASWQATTYWICTLSNNQWKLQEELPGTTEESSFYLALRSQHCQGCVMVLDQEALPLTRSWCLFELLQTFLIGEEQPDRFAGVALCTRSGVLSHGATRVDVAMGIAQRLSTLRLQDATASIESDKTMIDAAVCMMDGGFEAMNRKVRMNVRDALLKVKDCFEQDFSDIVTALDTVPSEDDLEQGGARVQSEVAAGAPGVTQQTMPMSKLVFWLRKASTLGGSRQFPPALPNPAPLGRARADRENAFGGLAHGSTS